MFTQPSSSLERSGITVRGGEMQTKGLALRNQLDLEFVGFWFGDFVWDPWN